MLHPAGLSNKEFAAVRMRLFDISSNALGLRTVRVRQQNRETLACVSDFQEGLDVTLRLTSGADPGYLFAGRPQPEVSQ